MNDTELRSEYQRLLAGRTDRGQCPDPERLRDLVERKGDETERLHTLDHAMACSQCRTEFELLRAIQTSRPRASRSYARPLALAASVVGLLAAGTIWLTIRSDTSDTLRGGSSMLELISPVGQVASGASTELSWHPATGEVRYLVQVVGQDGEVVFGGVTRDSQIVLPDTISLVPATEYRWWVVARFADGSEVASPIETFEIQRR
jgi:hypothetical protein